MNPLNPPNQLSPSEQLDQINKTDNIRAKLRLLINLICFILPTITGDPTKEDSFNHLTQFIIRANNYLSDHEKNTAFDPSYMSAITALIRVVLICSRNNTPPSLNLEAPSVFDAPRVVAIISYAFTNKVAIRKALTDLSIDYNRNIFIDDNESFLAEFLLDTAKTNVDFANNVFSWISQDDDRHAQFMTQENIWSMLITANLNFEKPAGESELQLQGIDYRGFLQANEQERFKSDSAYQVVELLEFFNLIQKAMYHKVRASERFADNLSEKISRVKGVQYFESWTDDYLRRFPQQLSAIGALDVVKKNSWINFSKPSYTLSKKYLDLMKNIEQVRVYETVLELLVNQAIVKIKEGSVALGQWETTDEDGHALYSIPLDAFIKK